MNALGLQILAEYYSCDRELLNNAGAIEKYMKHAALEAGATIVTTAFHTFNPFGVSGVIVIAESHLSIHTWPEYGYAAVDIFTCGDIVDPWKAFYFLRDKLQSGHFSTMEMKRGQIGVVVQELRHKPLPASAGGM
jgi:S-adenosylmethionine decarboxylase proenzyme